MHHKKDRGYRGGRGGEQVCDSVNYQTQGGTIQSYCGYGIERYNKEHVLVFLQACLPKILQALLPSVQIVIGTLGILLLQTNSIDFPAVKSESTTIF